MFSKLTEWLPVLSSEGKGWCIISPSPVELAHETPGSIPQKPKGRGKEDIMAVWVLEPEIDTNERTRMYSMIKEPEL